MASAGSHCTCPLVPRAALRAHPLHYIQSAHSSSHSACQPIKRTALRKRPLHQRQMAVNTADPPEAFIRDFLLFVCALGFSPSCRQWPRERMRDSTPPPIDPRQHILDYMHRTQGEDVREHLTGKEHNCSASANCSHNRSHHNLDDRIVACRFHELTIRNHGDGRPPSAYSFYSRRGQYARSQSHILPSIILSHAHLSCLCESCSLSLFGLSSPCSRRASPTILFWS